MKEAERKKLQVLRRAAYAACDAVDSWERAQVEGKSQDATAKFYAASRRRRFSCAPRGR
jgi:hypothetical protein